MTNNDSSDRRGYLLPFLDGNSYLFGVGPGPRTRADLAMSYLSASLRRKPNWWVDYKDQYQRATWLREAQEQLFGESYEFHLTDRQINYVLNELRGYDALRQSDNGLGVSCFDRIWEAGNVFDEAQRVGLIETLTSLSSVSDISSSGLLVDPYRHAMIFSRTRTRSGVVVAPPVTNDYAMSTRFAALPTDVRVSEDGKSTRFLSYINGIAPGLSSVHMVLSNLLSRAMPVFENVLTDLHRNNPLRQRIKGTFGYAEWDEPDPPEDSDDEEGWTLYEREMAHWMATRPIVLPEVPENDSCDDLVERKHVVCLNGKNIQIFVRIFNVMLDAEKPRVAWNNRWHVEGMKNERIVACVHYYARMENINTPRLEFRMAVNCHVDAKGDHVAAFRTWGLRDGDESNQYLGYAEIREGLAVGFPNLYQQKHSSLELLDISMPGCFSVVSFLLVDPDALPIMSTSSVPPQQREWILDAMMRSIDERLPNELLIRIVDEVEGLLSENEADRYHSEMTKERERFHDSNNERYFSLPFRYYADVHDHD